MTLQTFWFILIAVLWTGYFFLEGFDFGVGMLLPIIGKDNTDRRVLINTIGPVWDANEVWLVTAGGATFAAFPNWYATLFSSFYLPLLLLLVALILRGVAFEYRAKVDSNKWRKQWDAAIIFGSYIPSILLGVAFTDILNGIAINKEGNFVGSFFSLVNFQSILGGVAFTSLFIMHGASYLSLKTTDEILGRSRRLTTIFSLLSAVILSLFLFTSNFKIIFSALTVIVCLFAFGFSLKDKSKLTFIFSGLTIAMLSVTIFASLYPNVIVSSLNEAFNLTVNNATSTPYTLKVMTVVALIMTPVVLLYQGWSYWVFRNRISKKDIPKVSTPMTK